MLLRAVHSINAGECMRVAVRVWPGWEWRGKTDAPPMLSTRAALRVGRLDVVYGHLSRAGGTAAGSTYDWSAIAPPPLPLPPLEETAARYLEQLRPLVTPVSSRPPLKPSPCVLCGLELSGSHVRRGSSAPRRRRRARSSMGRGRRRTRSSRRGTRPTATRATSSRSGTRCTWAAATPSRSTATPS